MKKDLYKARVHCPASHTLAPDLKMNSFLFLLTSFIVVSGSSWHKFVNKYATIKILSGCLGEEFVMQWHANYSRAAENCYQSDPEEFMKLLSKIKEMPAPVSLFNDDAQRLNEPELNVQPVDHGTQFMSGVQTPEIVDLNDVFSAIQSDSNIPFLLIPIPGDVMKPTVLQPDLQSRQHLFFRRLKRDTDRAPYFDQEKIAKIHETILMKATNFTCVVHRLGMFNMNFDVDVQRMFQQLDGLSLDAGLKRDLQEGITDCIRFTECKPQKTMTFVPGPVQKATAFLKCEIKQKMAACVKADLMKKQHKFDVEALEEVGDDQMDEGDKMFALIYGDMMGQKKKF